MIKCKEGKIKVEGRFIDILGELCTLTEHIFKCAKDEFDDEGIKVLKESINNAIALGLGEKTHEEVFGKSNDDDEDKDVEELIDEIIELLRKGSK